MSQSSNQSVPASPESQNSITTTQREKLIDPRNFVYYTPGNSPTPSSVAVVCDVIFWCLIFIENPCLQASYPPSPDISFVFRPISYAPVKEPSNPIQPPSSPVVDARKRLKFGNKRLSTKKPFRKNFRNGIFKVLKKVDPNGTISSKAMDVMNDLICDLFERIAISSKELCQKTCKKTLMIRDINSAIRVLIPGQLGSHAFYEGWRAVKRCCDSEAAARKLRD